MKVLLVEDEIDVGKVILSYLKQWEMEAIHAESSQDALKVLDDGAVDLLITDLLKQKIYEACRARRQQLIDRRCWRPNEKSPMLAAEREIAGGLTHNTAGEILARKWDLSDELCNVVLHHHQPEIDNTFAFLIGLADFIGQSLYPFPRKARYPLAQALEDGDLKSARAFLPEGFSDQPLLTPTELVELAQAISSKVKQLTEDMRQTVQ